MKRRSGRSFCARFDWRLRENDLRRGQFDSIIANVEGPLVAVIDAVSLIPAYRRLLLWVIDPCVCPIAGIALVRTVQRDGYTDAVAFRDVAPRHVAALPERILGGESHRKVDGAIGVIADHDGGFGARRSDIQ